MMQQALRPYAVAGIAVLGTGSLMAFTPVAAPLPDVHVPAIQLTSDSSLLGDFSSLFGDVTGGTSGIGGLGDLTGLVDGLNPSSLLSDLPGLASLDPAPATSSLLSPYIDLFTKSFDNLQMIGSEFFDTTLPGLQTFLQEIIAGDIPIAELPTLLIGALTDPGTITTTLSTGGELPYLVTIALGDPLVLGLAEVGPLVTTLVDGVEPVLADLTSGNPTEVLTGLIDGPAYIANGLLNGTTSVDLPVLGDVSLFNGLLVPGSDVNVDVDLSTLISALDSISPALGTTLGGTVVTALDDFLALLPPDQPLADITVGPFAGLIDTLANVILAV
jgi:hypothetical protein